ncbi:histone H1.3 [Callorhinchus milii]|uniref:Histone H1.3-like n=1 Tax=Callorhinchus milii TaxID=7868 RepID=V9L8L1_CALMI|nr:histone H1.3 [Callorhinchus milii]|eukprot:gi/632987491/ref/XP_007882588.1/ PREDICTED: histone H1.3-like [Callorhinchus milii]
MAETHTTRADHPAADPAPLPAVAAADPSPASPQKAPVTPAAVAADFTAAAAAHPTPVSKKRRRRNRRNRYGSTVADQIMRAVAATKERRGLSVAAMKKMLSANGYDVTRNNSRVNQTVKSLVSKGSLVQTTGIGASGSFRLANSHEAGEVPVGETGEREQPLKQQQEQQQLLLKPTGEEKKVTKKREAAKKLLSQRKRGVKKLFRRRAKGKVGRPKKAVTRALRKWRLMKMKSAKRQVGTKHTFGRN